MSVSALQKSSCRPLVFPEIVLQSSYLSSFLIITFVILKCEQGTSQVLMELVSYRILLKFFKDITKLTKMPIVVESFAFIGHLEPSQLLSRCHVYAPPSEVAQSRRRQDWRNWGRGPVPLPRDGSNIR